MVSRATALSLAAKAFEEALERLHLSEDAPELQNPSELGRRAALLAVAESAWGQVLGPLFDTDQTRTILGVGSRQAVHDLMKRRRLLALDASNGRKLFPAFQFGRGGRPYPEVAEVIDIFSDVVETPYTIASWFVNPVFSFGSTPIWA